METTWSYAQIRDPAFLESLIPDVTNLHGTVVIEFSDGRLRVGVRQAFLNLYFWQILTDFGLPICKRHFLKYRPPNNDNLMEMLNAYYHEIMGLDVHNAKRLKMSIWNMLQKLYKLACTDLLTYVASIDMEDMAEIMEDPAMKEILDTKWQLKPEMGTDVIEKYIDVQNKKIMKLMGTKGGLKNEALYPYQQVRQLNKFQVPQTIYAFGVRTDVNDNIIRLPVIGSALDGLRNIQEFAVESLSAKKSAFYNHVAVADSQYFGRKQHLIASAIEHIYEGDCGSTALVKFHVTESNCMNLVGKNIMDHGVMINLNEQNVRQYIEQDVMMRSPMTCRYRRGVCEVCGGRILSNINRKLNIGILSAVHVIEPTTQKILSAKHLIKTSSLVYAIPSAASKVLVRSKSSELKWKPDIAARVKRLDIGIPMACMKAAIHDITMLRTDRPFVEEQFTSMFAFALRDRKGNVHQYQLESGGQIPFLSAEMLIHFRDHYNEKELSNDIIWLPLAGTENIPIFCTVVVNDNMLQFVTGVNRFLSTKIRDYTDCGAALQAFSDVIYSKVSTNIAHIEVLLKAYEIEGNGRFDIPLVTDPTHVHFQTNSAILSNRFVGVKLGFEKLKEYSRSASTYLVAKAKSPFDLMIGYEDV